MTKTPRPMDQRCGTCHGSGQVSKRDSSGKWISAVCPSCGGSGKKMTRFTDGETNDPSLLNRLKTALVLANQKSDTRIAEMLEKAIEATENKEESK